MLYSDVMHPVNIVWLLYDMVLVTVRTLRPETLVRKRRKRTPRESGKDEKRRGEHNQHGESQPGSHAASVNTSLNASAYTSGELPPQVPHRSLLSVPRSRHDSSRGRSRSRSHSGGRRERERERVTRWSWSDWRKKDVTKEVTMVMDFLRLAPVAVIHFFCQLKIDADTLPLLEFSDLNDTARRLLWFNGNALFASGMLFALVTTRALLGITQRYLMERLFFETNIVVRGLRSRRAWRNAYAWVMSLSSHLLTDPIAFSLLTPMLLNRVHDLSPTKGPLRYTHAGVLRALAVGFAGVVLEMLITPAASQFCQRAVVRVVDGAEYLLLRRYAQREAPPQNGAGRGDATSNANSEDERDTHASRASQETHHHHHSFSSSRSRDHNDRGDDESDAERRRGRRTPGDDDEERQHRRRLRRQERALRRKRDEESRVLLRAIIYRVVSALIAQCLVHHPLTVVAHMLYGRAVLHAAGLLTPYNDAPAVSLTWRGFVGFFRTAFSLRAREGQSSGVVALETLRNLGGFVGNEANLISNSIRRCSARDVAIRSLTARFEENPRKRGFVSASSTPKAGDLAMESIELLMLSIASLSPLFAAVRFTAIDKLLSFYVAVWLRLHEE